MDEYLDDRALDPALIPSKRDLARDVFFGTLGALGALGLASLPAPRRPPG